MNDVTYSPFSDALRSLSQRMPQAVREREILRVRFATSPV